MANNCLLLEHYPQSGRIRYRPFAWSEHAYTFGVSQKWTTYREVVPHHVPLVRRCTGGGLVSHLEDWTFAIAIPVDHELYKADANEAYAVVHKALLECLLEQKLPVELVLHPLSPRAFKAPDQCEAHAEPHDLVLKSDGRKVAGAAQRRTRHGLLLEGYISRPLLAGCNWNKFAEDFPHALGKTLNSPPVVVKSPIYDQADHEGMWAKFNSTAWNQRI
jgi:lipoate-protein ligase A